MSPDDLVRVAGGRNQTEAEYIQNILREEGIQSMLQRSGGFDVPDFLAAGPRDVMVMAANSDRAREVLESAGFDTRRSADSGPDPARLLFGLVVAVVVVGAIVFAGAEISV